MTRPLPAWRSILFVPVLSDRFIDGAPRRGADCIQLDLEDAIPPDRKAEARACVGEVADHLSGQNCDVIVRINRPFRQAIPDIEASVRQSVTALTLPKVPDATHIRSLVEVIEEIEGERQLAAGHTSLIAMIETADAVERMTEIAAASPRVVGIIIGAEDLAVSMGMKPTHLALQVPNLRLVAAARAAGCLPLGFIGSIAGFSDLDAYRDLIREARSLGFTGAFAIHPAQVHILNEEFSPSSEEIAYARGLIDAFDAAAARGEGAVSYQGKMIDLPVVEQSKAILAAAQKYRMGNGDLGG